jgi:hypothetical protein
MINTLVWRGKQILTAVDATFTCSNLTPPANVAGANTNSRQVEWVKGRDARFRPKGKVRTASFARILTECASANKEVRNVETTHLQNYGYRQWPRGLRRESAAARLMGLLVRIPSAEWMSVYRQCCVLSGRGLCYWPITRPDKSGVFECDLKTSITRTPWPTSGRCATGMSVSSSMPLQYTGLIVKAWPLPG